MYFSITDEWQSCSCSTLKSVEFTWMTTWWDVCSLQLHISLQSSYQRYRINNKCFHLPFGLQRKEAVALHVKLLDLNNEFLLRSHLPNRIARAAIPEHLHVHFATEGSSIQVGGLHADSPHDLVCPSFALSCYGVSAFRSAGGAFAKKETVGQVENENIIKVKPSASISSKCVFWLVRLVSIIVHYSIKLSY